MRPVTLNSGFSSGDFSALMARRPFDIPFAETITIRMTYSQWAGSNLFLTTAQNDFLVPACDGTGLTHYVSNDIGIDKGALKLKAGSGQSGAGSDPTSSIEVDSQSLTLEPNMNPVVPSVINGVPFLQAVRQRAFDGAIIQRDRWFFDPDIRTATGLPTPVGGMPMFYGYASSIDQLGRTRVTHKVKSALVMLDIQMPRHLFQPNCVYTVYSGSCGAVKSSFANSGVVGSSPTASVIPWTGGVPGSIPFANGEIFMESGPAVNQTRTIRAYDGTNLYLAYPLNSTPLVGDMFKAYPGCNRADPLAAGSTSNCIYFGRQAAYRATPRVPQAELGL